MYKCILVFLLFITLIPNKLRAQEIEQVVTICNTCLTKNQFETTALSKVNGYYSSGFMQKRVTVANIEIKSLKSFLVLISNEPGFYEREVIELAIPSDVQEAFDIYNGLETSFNQSGRVDVNIAPAIKKAAVFVAAASGANAPPSCNISGDMNPVPPYIADSVKDIDGDIDVSQKAIREMLRNVYFAGGFGWIKTATRDIISKFLLERPLTVWTSFDDGTKVQWMLADLRSSLPFILMPESAIDSNCNPVAMGSSNYLSFGNGSYSFSSAGKAYYSGIGMALYGNRVCNIRYTGTVSEGVMKPQLVCY